MKNFKCKKCGHNEVEEVMSGVVQSSVINSIELIGDNELLLDYGNTCTAGGDVDSIYYQCVMCGHPVTKDELIKLSKGV